MHLISFYNGTFVVDIVSFVGYFYLYLLFLLLLFIFPIFLLVAIIIFIIVVVYCQQSFVLSCILLCLHGCLYKFNVTHTHTYTCLNLCTLNKRNQQGNQKYPSKPNLLKFYQFIKNFLKISKMFFKIFFHLKNFSNLPFKDPFW